MKRSARNPPFSHHGVNCLGSAFAARKRGPGKIAPVAKTADENGDTPLSEDFETPEFTEASDDEIELSNAFEALRDKDVAATPTPAKRVNISARLTDVSASPPDASAGVGKLSTCGRKRIHVLEDEGAAKVTLLPDEIITVTGAFILSVLQGSVSILGARLDAPAALPIFAPQSHSLPIIKCLKSKVDGKLVRNILLLESLVDSGIEKLPKICPFSDKLFDAPAKTMSISPSKASFHVLTESTVHIATTTYPLSWEEAVKAILQRSSPKVLVCGTKGAGKSTFAQYLANSLLSRGNVTYLETDPGQPSFSPPGLVSLHSLTTPIYSPAFTRTSLNDLIRAQHIGNISPRDNPRHYINCIANLLSHVPSEAPVIVNTPGWTKGNGFELLSSLIEIIQPSFVVVVSVRGNDSLATSLQPHVSDAQSHLLVIESGNSIPPPMVLTAADLRTLGFMSYFHSTGTGKWDFGTHLTAWKPCIVNFTGPERGIMAVAIQAEDLVTEDIVLAINGTIVAIILVDEDWEGTVDLTPEGIPVLVERESKFLDPRTSRCVGYAIIRGLDLKAGEMYLLTPWDPETIRKDERVILERGRVNLPVWGMWDWQNPRPLAPWLQTN